MAPKARARLSRALEGEDLKTSHWEDARHWMSIYTDLLEFKRGILDRVSRDVASLQPLARKAAAPDVQIIEDQMQGYQARLDQSPPRSAASTSGRSLLLRVLDIVIVVQAPA